MIAKIVELQPKSGGETNLSKGLEALKAKFGVGGLQHFFVLPGSKPNSRQVVAIFADQKAHDSFVSQESVADLEQLKGFIDGDIAVREAIGE